MYLRRTYGRINEILYPDTIVFLGDLFDGGREWSTRSTTSPEMRWRRYGEDFWIREYMRFVNIFDRLFSSGGSAPRPGQAGRKVLSSLPGNHDLGFGKGIQASVKKRFAAYFGEGNRVDMVGNHTLVSLDSVSLSALGQESAQADQDIWQPSREFLDQVVAQRKRLARKELRRQHGLAPDPPWPREVIQEKDFGSAKAALPEQDGAAGQFPVVLLSHVPLYRAPGTPCGPLREHWPPSPPAPGQTGPPTEDERNAISVSGGYQYQNVLNAEVTKEIVEKVGDIQYAFSGDDHDYCEVVHRAYPPAGAGIKEITVKSISLAMGVRKPGVVMASLWNPVDDKGMPVHGGPTLQTHLCLLPDQLGVYTCYITLFGLTLVGLATRAALVAANRLSHGSMQTPPSDGPLLPTSELCSSSAENEKAGLYERQADHHSHDCADPPNIAASRSLASSEKRGNLMVRTANARTRSVSPGPGGYGLPPSQNHHPQHQTPRAFPLIQHAGYYGPAEGQARTRDEGEGWAMNGRSARAAKSGSRSGSSTLTSFMRELRGGMLKVGVMASLWWLWLVWRG